MDAQKMAHALGTKKVGYRGALIASAAALSCLLIYIWACVFSPVTWSPDSSKIAILVTPSDDSDDPAQFAIFTYDTATGEHLLLDETRKDGVLSAPAWSPDGKWIAYYKVEPRPPDPNAKTQPVAELFSEEPKMAAPFLWEIAKEKLAEEKDAETFDVKLISVSPDAKERKVLHVFKWQGDEDVLKHLVLIRPIWSPDSRTIFYARAIAEADLFYIGSLDLTTGKTQAHLFSAIGTPALSADGKQLASVLKTDSEDSLLAVAQVNGSSHKYFKLGLKMEDAQAIFFPMAWSPDSKRLLVPAEENFWLVDPETGAKQKCSDPDAEKVAYAAFSRVDNNLYYVAGHEGDEPDTPPERIYLKRMDPKTKKATTVFQFSDFPEDTDGGTFSISPNGKMVLLRCAIREDGDKKSMLIFWDGKTRKVVETDPWLIKLLFTDEDLVFEEKLLGKWKSQDGTTLTSKRKDEKTYKMTVLDTNGDVETATVNLFRARGMLFLRAYADEADEIVYLKVDQIEPKLLLREMESDEIAELLEKGPESLQQEEVDYAFEGVRVRQPEQ